MTTKIQPFLKNRRFYNAHNQRAESFLFGTLPSFVRSMWHKRGKKPPFQVSDWLHTKPSAASRSDEPCITWIGHSTFLIQIAGVTILTDPIFGSPSWLFPRVIPAGIPVSLLPAIDLILISHNHRDHMDAPSLAAIRRANPHVKVMVGLGDKRWFDRREFAHTTEHGWWDERIVQTARQEKIRIVFLPAWHWSARGIFDKNRSLWGSWMIEASGHTIYFAGDTAYSPHFVAIANEFPSIDIALLPIGPCEPRDWMRHTHLDAHEAVQAFIELKAGHFIPMHWGTFGFGNDHVHLPLERLNQAWQEREAEVGEGRLHIVKAGQRVYTTRR